MVKTSLTNIGFFFRFDSGFRDSGQMEQVRCHFVILPLKQKHYHIALVLIINKKYKSYIRHEDFRLLLRSFVRQAQGTPPDF